MKLADEKFINEIDRLTADRIAEIRALPDRINIVGTKYYVSADGNDSNDGKSIDTPWKTLARVDKAQLLPGDGVLFRRGDG